MGLSITSANATFFLAVASVFPTPLQLQGFATEDVFETEPVEAAEVAMGVDGFMSAGFVFVPVKQTIALQAGSDSNDLFDNWYAAQQVAQELFRASGVLLLPSISKKWQMTNGVLSSYKPIPDAKKKLEPRRFGITWERVSPALA